MYDIYGTYTARESILKHQMGVDMNMDMDIESFAFASHYYWVHTVCCSYDLMPNNTLVLEKEYKRGLSPSPNRQAQFPTSE